MPEDLQREDQFPDNPNGWAKRWAAELEAAEKATGRWHKRASTAIDRYRDNRGTDDTDDTRWNLFAANVDTLRASLFGRTPQASAGRHFEDPDDDVARVGGEMLERILNAGIARFGDEYSVSLRNALDDRLLAGLGVQRWLYEKEAEVLPGKPEEPSGLSGGQVKPATPATEKVKSERAVAEYVHWRDFLWSPARTWEEVRWVAFRLKMSRATLIERFGEDIGSKVPLNSKDDETRKDAEQHVETPWARAEVWEIWDKGTRCRFWWVKGYATTLGRDKDPLGLDGFFPCQRPMFANLTTSELVPGTDYDKAKDLYEEMDKVCTRITTLERAIRVVGIYDQTAKALQQLLNDAADNEMIPVPNWNGLSEKGGLKGAVDWFPLEAVVSALLALRDYRNELKQALYEVTGMADVIRGQGTQVATTAAENNAKVKFGSIRLQALQEEFARFASDGKRIEAEIIAKHFAVDTIVTLSNAAKTPDAAIAPQAAAFIKSDLAGFRIEIKPEAINLQDFAAIREERTEVITAVGNFMTAAAPLLGSAPAVLPFMLETMKWMVSGLRGAAEIEGVFDRAIQAAQNAPPQQPGSNPDAAKLQAVMAKGQMDLQREKVKADARQQEIAAEVVADEKREQFQAQYGLQEAAGKALIAKATRPQGTPERPGQPGQGVVP